MMSAETSKGSARKNAPFRRRKEARVSSREEAPIDDEEARAVGVASEENDRMRAKRKCAAVFDREARACVANSSFRRLRVGERTELIESAL